MRWSKLFIPTRKEPPANSRSKAEGLLLRAGFIQTDSKGRWTWLPLGTRTLRKLEYQIRVRLEELQSIEIASHLDSPDLAASILQGVQSYRDVPLGMHRVRTDEENRTVIDVITFRAGRDGSHLLRDVEGRIVGLLEGLNIKPFPVGEGDPAPAWVAGSPDGAARILVSDKSNYSALAEEAESAVRDWTFSGAADVDLESIETPGAKSVSDVARLLDAPVTDVLKTLVFQTITAGPALNSGINPNWVIAVVRGDQDVNFNKLERVARENFSVGLRPLSDTPELREKFTVGFVGPDAATRYWDAVLIVDPEAAQDQKWIAGANTADHHVRNFNWFRECGDKLADPKKTVVAPIHVLGAGDASPRKDGGILSEMRARLLLSAERIDRCYPNVIGTSGRSEPVTAEHQRIDLDEIISAVAEQRVDEQGLRWPAAIAPFEVVITPIKYDGVVKSAADSLHDQMISNGIAVLLDDRDDRAGSKFADADLIGVPVRVTIGERTLSEGQLEIKLRDRSESVKLPLNQTAAYIANALQNETWSVPPSRAT